MKVNKSYLKKILASVLIAVIGYVTKHNYDEKVEHSTVSNYEGKYDFLPATTTGDIIHHNGFSLSYNEKHEQAEWLAYYLSDTDISYVTRKRPYFVEDPKVTTRSASWKNYKNSGYDKGHLCPAADKKYDERLYHETFYTSNVSPQLHAFNAGVWNKLENKIRYWAKKYHHLYVITGGVFNGDLKTIGREKVSVPNAFYKIILDCEQPEMKAIAFLIPHKKTNQPLYHFVVSIDELETLTGIDFFKNLPEQTQNILETEANYKEWSFR